jgi:hypothetical protein
MTQRQCPECGGELNGNVRRNLTTLPHKPNVENEQALLLTLSGPLN